MPEHENQLNPARKTPPARHPLLRLLGSLAGAVSAIVCIAVVAVLLFNMVMTVGSGTAASSGGVSGVTIMDKFDMFMTNQMSIALDGVLNIEKVYWLSDTDLVAPKPDPECYGTANSPGELQWLLEEAADLIGDQEMLFNENIRIWERDKIYYYYDETILVITWKEEIDNSVYTISEVKIAHPSQFRRFLANGEFGSDKQYITTDMAKSVNAVVASSGDFYKHRYNGIVVHEGQIKRAEFDSVDTCFINDQGDLLFSYRKEFQDQAAAQQFVDENNVRFSLAFGPVLIDNGEIRVPDRYALGEIDGYYSRMALCQRDELHYLLVNATAERASQRRPLVIEFAQVIQNFGCDKAYALDGGQTTVIAMDGELISSVDFGFQRQISDIIYFATALPDGE